MNPQQASAWSGAVLVIGNDRLEMGVVPDAGGSTAFLRVRRGATWADVLRPATAASLLAGDRLAFANWPLAPYSNRIAGGVIRCLPGREVRVPANAPSISAHVLHGHGWLLPWQVDARSASAVTLSLELDATAAWPWRHRIEQTLTLSAQEARASLRVTNLSNEPMPAGIGWHPYFVRTPGCTIATRQAGIWWSQDEIPVRHEPLPKALDMSAGVRLADLPASDNCFTGWSGEARMAWPEAQLEVEMSADPTMFGHTVFYNPAGRDFYCFEPVSHATNAPGLEPDAAVAAGLRILASGQTLEGSFGLRVL